MAEYLIYIKQHWMDALSAAEVTELSKNPIWKRKYDARYRVGDIVSVRPDGYWTGPMAKGFNHAAFKVVSVPGQAMDNKYRESLDKIEETGDPIAGPNVIVVKRSTYNITALNLSDKETMTLTQFTQKLNKKKLEE